MSLSEFAVHGVTHFGGKFLPLPGRFVDKFAAGQCNDGLCLDRWIVGPSLLCLADTGNGAMRVAPFRQQSPLQKENTRMPECPLLRVIEQIRRFREPAFGQR